LDKWFTGEGNLDNIGIGLNTVSLCQVGSIRTGPHYVAATMS